MNDKKTPITHCYWLTQEMCDITCKGCYYTIAPKRMVSQRNEIEVAQKLIQYGFKTIALTGGDPMFSKTRATTFEIIELFKKSKLKVILKSTLKISNYLIRRCKMIHFQTRIPKEDGDGYHYLESAGYVKMIDGFPAYSTLGILMLEKIHDAMKHISIEKDFFQLQLPLIQKNIIDEKYQDSIFQVKDDMALATGGEKYISETFSEIIKFSSFGQRFRKMQRPRHGLIYNQSFYLFELYSIYRHNNHQKEINTLKSITESVLDYFKIDWHKVEYKNIHSYITKSKNNQNKIYECSKCKKLFREYGKCCGLELKKVSGMEFADVSIKNIPIKNNLNLVFAGIGVSRILQLIAEKYSYKTGLKWPEYLSPVDYCIITIEERHSEALEIKRKKETLGFKSIVYTTNRKKIGRVMKNAEIQGFSKIILLSKDTSFLNRNLDDKFNKIKVNELVYL